MRIFLHRYLLPSTISWFTSSTTLCIPRTALLRNPFLGTIRSRPLFLFSLYIWILSFPTRRVPEPGMGTPSLLTSIIVRLWCIWVVTIYIYGTLSGIPVSVLKRCVSLNVTNLTLVDSLLGSCINAPVSKSTSLRFLGPVC